MRSEFITRWNICKTEFANYIRKVAHHSLSRSFTLFLSPVRKYDRSSVGIYTKLTGIWLRSMDHPVRIELTNDGLLAKLISPFHHTRRPKTKCNLYLAQGHKYKVSTEDRTHNSVIISVRDYLSFTKLCLVWHIVLLKMATRQGPEQDHRYLTSVIWRETKTSLLTITQLLLVDLFKNATKI